MPRFHTQQNFYSVRNKRNHSFEVVRSFPLVFFPFSFTLGVKRECFQLSVLNGFSFVRGQYKVTPFWRKKNSLSILNLSLYKS